MITGFPTTLYLLSVFVSVASALHFPSISFRNPHSSASSLSIPSRPVVAQYHLSFKPSTSPSDDNKDDAVDLSYYFYIFANLDGSLEADDTKEKRKMWLHDQKSREYPDQRNKLTSVKTDSELIHLFVYYRGKEGGLYSFRLGRFSFCFGQEG